MADYRCKILESSLDGMLLNIQNIQVWVVIIGEFNAYNLLKRFILRAIELGLDSSQVLKSISCLSSQKVGFTL